MVTDNTDTGKINTVSSMAESFSGLSAEHEYIRRQNRLKEEKVSREIRSDFDGALSKNRHGDELSAELGFGFYAEDVRTLMELHRADRHRKKIEELLADCNFHPEVRLLREGKYEELEKSLEKF